MARAKGFMFPFRSGKRQTNANTGIAGGRVQSPKITSSQSSTAVGRPGFKNLVPAANRRTSVRTLKVNDPSKKNIADTIATANIDRVGAQSPRIMGGTSNTASNSGKKVIRPPRQSLPVRASSPGRIRRGPR